jgi:hypothetical protein
MVAIAIIGEIKVFFFFLDWLLFKDDALPSP